MLRYHIVLSAIAIGLMGLSPVSGGVFEVQFEADFVSSTSNAATLLPIEGSFRYDEEDIKKETSPLLLSTYLKIEDFSLKANCWQEDLGLGQIHLTEPIISNFATNDDSIYEINIGDVNQQNYEIENVVVRIMLASPNATDEPMQSFDSIWNELLSGANLFIYSQKYIPPSRVYAIDGYLCLEYADDGTSYGDRDVNNYGDYTIPSSSISSTPLAEFQITSFSIIEIVPEPTSLGLSMLSATLIAFGYNSRKKSFML